MRGVRRLPLHPEVQTDLERRQTDADLARAAGTLRVNDTWSAARRTPTLDAVMTTLRRMMGDRERCMYCMDSHGSDIEHFWPKTPYPERMFRWLNLLLCCTECGRFKGDRFPLSSAGLPLLVDPTVEDPWEHLDFDPDMGLVVARFEQSTGRPSPKGESSVAILQLDRREAMSTGYRQTFRRLTRLVESFLAEGGGDVERLARSLREADDHGLLGWCVTGNGRNVPPFRDLHERHPEMAPLCIEPVASA
jgi:uncharacterized protein (TIGR02646 family)